jgi:hypothetical protein
MNRQKINFIAATVAIVLAVQALLILLLGITTGWDRHLSDEGPAAHIFQILIAAEALFTMVFLGTADWKRLRPVSQIVGVQAVLFGLTFAIGKFFHI